MWMWMIGDLASLCSCERLRLLVANSGMHRQQPYCRARQKFPHQCITERTDGSPRKAVAKQCIPLSTPGIQ